jgi:hypothetical protein
MMVYKSVKHWGPLWGTSAFIFEDASRILLRMLHGDRKASKQVFESYLNAKYLKPMAKVYFNESTDDSAVKLFNKLSHVRVPCRRAVRFDCGVVAMGNGKVSHLTVCELLAVEACIGRILLTRNITRFDRIILNGTVIHSAKYAAKFKRNDSFITLHNSSAVLSLHSCVQLSSSDELLFIVQRLNVRSR